MTSSAVSPLRSDAKKALLLALFAVAMGYLEAAVVVYLRRIYYPMGFAFPLHSALLDPTFLVEPGRELATIIMLAVVAGLSGKNRLERWAWFLFLFGVWDIFYYVGLKALLDRPASLLTWDILFLIPIPWAAPVLSPVLVAASMILMGLVVVGQARTEHAMRSTPVDWLVMATGGAAILWSYVSSYAALVIRHGLPSRISSLHSELTAGFAAHVPSNYPWWLFGVGLALIWAAFVRISCRNSKL